MSPSGKLTEVFKAFLKLGCISFGGPIAHLSYFYEEFVTKRRWLDDASYGDLLALCQFLPGPGSSQMVFALGKHRAGLPGALVASLCFILPSAILMILFGYGISAVGNLNNAGWLHGLKLAAVAVVAQAVWGMGRKLCPDRARQALSLGTATLVLIHPGSFGQVGSIAFGALIGGWIYCGAVPDNGVAPKLNVRAHIIAGSCLAAFFILLVALPVLATATRQTNIMLFDSFYRAGSLVFGGGHVVLPLLRAEVVPKGWVGIDAFLAGYGAAQALPGPLFTFCAYLGTVMQPGRFAWARGLWCLLAIYLPGWLLLGGALPFWEQLRRKSWMQAALKGANAAVVGVLLAALYTPVSTEAVKNTHDFGLVLVAFGLLELWKTPAWLVVALAAIAGQFILL